MEIPWTWLIGGILIVAVIGVILVNIAMVGIGNLPLKEPPEKPSEAPAAATTETTTGVKAMASKVVSKIRSNGLLSFLVFALLAIAIVLILGWNPAATVRHWMGVGREAKVAVPGQVAKTVAVSQPERNFNVNLICRNAFRNEVHLEDSGEKYFTVNLPEGCYSGTIYLPRDWNTWSFQAGDGAPPDCWVSFWYATLPPRPPQSCNDNMSARSWWTTKQVEVQGKGTLLFYKTG